MTPIENYRDLLRAKLTADIANDVLPDHLNTVVDHIASQVVIDDAGRPVRPVLDILAGMMTAEPWWFSKAPKSPPNHPPSPKDGMGIQAAMTAARAKAAADNLAQIEAIAAGPNPFSAATRNLSKQGLLLNRAPEIAARLQREAGAK